MPLLYFKLKPMTLLVLLGLLVGLSQLLYFCSAFSSSSSFSSQPQQQQQPKSFFITTNKNNFRLFDSPSAVVEVKEEESSSSTQSKVPSSTTTTTVTTTIDSNNGKEETEEEAKDNGDEDNDDMTTVYDNIFDIVSGRAAVCLYESEMRRDAKINNVTTPSSATNWINDATAFALQKAVDKIKIKVPEERTGLDRDDATAWIRWMKSSPTPIVVDLSDELRNIANDTISEQNFNLISLSRDEFLSRLGCRLLLFPSGSALSSPLLEPPASMIYGKLLYGGITRYRRLISSNSKRPPRKAGERTAIKMTAGENIPAWIQYGGTERMYEAVDMGPAAVLEVIVLPKAVIARGATLSDLVLAGGSSSAGADSETTNGSSGGNSGDMVIQNLAWKPQQIFDMIPDENNQNNTNKQGSSSLDSIDFVTGYTPISQSGKDRNDAFEADFKSSVGGLGKQIDAIVRRVLDGRVIRPAQEGTAITSNDVADGEGDETATALSMAAMEAEELAVLGLTPVRGLLLYGPPGTGKTLLARQIARALRARTPKIVSAPELLDRWVGGSEKLVRSLFAEAEAELAVCNGDATQSALHVVVIDEIDAVFRRRSSGEDSGEATRASVVNQILAKLDGINAINNVLIIGLTNRRELLDSALLRPGRLEVQIEVPLPDTAGRREILQIHFDALRKKGRLSKPLCCAIDGIPPNSAAVSSGLTGRKRDVFKRAIKNVWYEKIRPTYDLAAVTDGFSGADIAGLVRCAGSLALSRARKDGNGVDGLLITLEDVKLALEEVKP